MVPDVPDIPPAATFRTLKRKATSRHAEYLKSTQQGKNSQTRRSFCSLFLVGWLESCPPCEAQKSMILTLMSGAFTPTCSANHLPGYISNLDKLHAKGVDLVAVLSFNDPWVMNAWSKAYGIKNDDIVRAPCLLGVRCTLWHSSC